MTGHNEVRYDEETKKVIYEPVKLEQNYKILTTKVLGKVRNILKSKLKNNG